MPSIVNHAKWLRDTPLFDKRAYHNAVRKEIDRELARMNEAHKAGDFSTVDAIKKQLPGVASRTHEGWRCDLDTESYIASLHWAIQWYSHQFGEMRDRMNFLEKEIWKAQKEAEESKHPWLTGQFDTLPDHVPQDESQQKEPV